MKSFRNKIITVFVIIWCLAFHYESVRYFYLNPLFGRTLPKIKFLFPPAGWIMFFQVDKAYGTFRIFGLKDGNLHVIDPHEIFRVRTIGYDNIHRGVIGSAAAPQNQSQFCRQLERRFDYFDNFIVVYEQYPDFIAHPYEVDQRPLYSCKPTGGTKQ